MASMKVPSSRIKTALRILMDWHKLGYNYLDMRQVQNVHHHRLYCSGWMDFEQQWNILE